MAFDPFAAPANQILTDSITDTQDLGIKQDRNHYSADVFGDISTIVASWSVAAENARLGTSTLAQKGTLTSATLTGYDTGFSIPAGFIITRLTVHTTEAKTSGSSVLTPSFLADTVTAISAIGVNDDTAALATGATDPDYLDADAAVKIFVVVTGASDATAGAFTMYIDGYYGVDDGS